ncbi:chemotaxis protein CheB [Actinoplanes sp. TFC3]|uniref:chemotaxis protein CheB n=1 Tax=Actinoplanes sp. TFC3 TaxID=1710355 RepID=UPI000AF4F91D|nr:chemotaxis protein CheB [Actinoplanes sp. TFC3]
MEPAFDVVVIGASAGGIEAVSAVLCALPRDFPAAVVVAMHFRAAGSHAAEVFARDTDMRVRVIDHGDRLEVGTVYVSPPGVALEVEPDGTVSMISRRNAHHPIDATLESAATSYRARVLAVILTGMLSDGARGVSAVKAQGGTVIVQSEASSLHPAMPKAAIGTGVVDMVLPLGDIGKTINAFVTRGVLPATNRGVGALEWVFGGNGTQATRLRAVDWAATSIGPVEDWSPELQAIVRLVMAAGMSMGVQLGDDYTLVINDAAAATLGRKPAEAVGRPYFQTWPEMKPHLGPVFEAVHRGEMFFSEDALFEFDANGRIEEKYYTSSFLPIVTSRGIEGVFGPGVETTVNVLAARRMRTLATLATVPRARDVNDTFAALLAALEDNPHDVPFAVAYEINAMQKQATLKGTVRVQSGSAIAPYVVDLQGHRPPWPFREVFETGTALLVSDLAARFDTTSLGPGPDPTAEALVYPIAGSPPGGMLVVGLNPRRVLDAPYRDFLDLLASQITAGILEAQAFTMSRRRAEALAEANRAKTELFSNVSHEFRTPLTLISGPLERALTQRAQLPDTVVRDLDVAQRSAQRLQLLVGSLLDMAQMEAKRLVPRFEEVDLAELTRSIVALFASAAEAAGVALAVDCPPLAATVAVDPEMWAKVVVNLMSNALKFTREGEIRVVLRARPQHAELVVSDTGVGIDEADQPYVFDRFFRGGRTAPRSGEGSGIGLALARELVQLHHGRIRVRSGPGEGATFTVWIPTFVRASKSQALPREAPADVAALAEGALAWAHTPAESRSVVGASQLEGLETIRAATTGSRVLVVDDNVDMRTYIQQLFAATGWRVDTAADGDDAFTRLREQHVDIVVADVMMPKTNGLELVRRVRTDTELRRTPIVLVTARADESAAIDGLLAGANDYITKPFSARELVARVGVQIELSRVQ